MTPEMTVGDFVAVFNQSLEYAYPEVILVGEVGSFKVSQGKFVFFDLKDAEATVGCFLMLFQLRAPIEDGMKVKIRATPKLTKFGKFSLTVKEIMLMGEGAIKKGLELLKEKLSREGLLAPERKRDLPEVIERIAVISSVGAAGYADFVKILNERWRGLSLTVASVAVQGFGAAEQMAAALKYFNERGEWDVIAIVRGGGSADDLAAFNDEGLARAIAGSKIPVITGVGHEVDESLADLAADARAATPSNAAERLSRDRKEVVKANAAAVGRLAGVMVERVDLRGREVSEMMRRAVEKMEGEVERVRAEAGHLREVLRGLNPEMVLRRGYAIVRGEMKVDGVVKITTFRENVTAVVKKVEKRR